MKSILDTCVLSEVQRHEGSPSVRRFVASLHPHDIYLSVVTIGELIGGVEKLDPGRRRDDLDRWIREIEDHHADRILPVTQRTARLWGEISGRARRRGLTIPASDGLIAATALHHDMRVITRNTTHFRAAGVRLFDPWDTPS